MQYIVEETNKYVQEQVAESAAPFTLHLRIRNWKDVILDETYIVLTLFMLTGILQKHTTKVLLEQEQFLYTPFFSETSQLGKRERVTRFPYFSHNLALSEYEGPARM
jgi:hypothetical protein